MDGPNDDELLLEVIEELTLEMRRWEAGVPVRRGVRALVKWTWMNLIDRQLVGRSREELALEVEGYGEIGRWLPCDIAAVSAGIRHGSWSELRTTIEEARCSECRLKEDVMCHVREGVWNERDRALQGALLREGPRSKR